MVFFDTRSLLYHLVARVAGSGSTGVPINRLQPGAAGHRAHQRVCRGDPLLHDVGVYDRVVPNNALDSLWVLTGAVVVVALFDLVAKSSSYLLEAAAQRRRR